MRSAILSAAVVITALPIAASQAAPISPQGLKAAAGEQSAIDQVQYRYAGREYCWYDDGWHGPGFYWCGYRLRTGFGWGGPEGWHGWRSAGEFRERSRIGVEERGRFERRGGIGVEERGRTVGRGGTAIEERGRVGVQERGRVGSQGAARIEERGRMGVEERGRVGAQGNARVGTERTGRTNVEGGTTGRGGTPGAAAPAARSGQGASGGSMNAPSGGSMNAPSGGGRGGER
jgi:hypothetical protein